MRETILKDIGRAVLCVLAAVLIYSLAGAAGPSVLVVLNAFAIVVVFFSVRRGEVFGAFLGTACGLVQDAFSLGVYGLGGLTMTLLGFWTGFIVRRIDVSPFLRHGAFLLVMSMLELGLRMLLTSVVRQEAIHLHGGLLLLQPLVTSWVASSIFAAERYYLSRRPRA